ncbi:unnamed protein product [Protopolystoma xenopodis]|uniref:Uncharacterized protein n=1 Tax=Protopolystoma xenopodis TaxID=117903 RepID=A0A448XRN8_9PLAT|nr:unnamed protein product [Protopolystoma xenopodis]
MIWKMPDISSRLPCDPREFLLAVETTASLLVRQAVVESSGGRAFGADTRLPGAAITLNTTDAFVSWLPHVSCSRCW